MTIPPNQLVTFEAKFLIRIAVRAHGTSAAYFAAQINTIHRLTSEPIRRALADKGITILHIDDGHLQSVQPIPNESPSHDAQ